MNRILSIFALIFCFSILIGCGETEIDYTGTSCELSDSARVVYNSELEIAFKTIDSSTSSMLSARGPKGNRVENEDIDEEYDGAISLSRKAKENIQAVLFNKHCVTVDNYRVETPSHIRYFNEFQLPVNDTAMFHAAKRKFFHGTQE